MTILTKESFLKAIDETKGTKTAIAEYFGVTFTAVWKFCEKNKEYTDILLRMAKKRHVSKAESNLYTIADMDTKDSKGDEVPALVGQKLRANETILKTQGKDDGWVERQESKVDVTHNEPIAINVIMPKEK